MWLKDWVAMPRTRIRNVETNVIVFLILGLATDFFLQGL